MGLLLQALYDDVKDKAGEENFNRHVQEDVPLLAPSIIEIGRNNNANRAFSTAARTSEALNTVASAANQTLSAMQKLHVVSSQIVLPTVAAAAGPAGVAASFTVEKLTQLRRWWKTKERLHSLVLIYFMAVDAGEKQELLDAIVFAIQQKKLKLSNAGLKGLIPGVVALQSQYKHMTKLWDGTLNIRERFAATTLFDYYKGGNEFAGRVIAELFKGGGQGLEDLVAKVNLREEAVVMQRSDDTVSEPGDGYAGGSGSMWSNKTGYVNLQDEDDTSGVKVAKMSFLDKVVTMVRGRKHTPLEATHEAGDEDRQAGINAIIGKLHDR